MNTNNKIRQIGFRMFLEKGYEAANIRDICKEVKIKPSSLYFHYKSKQDLFISLYDEIWSETIKSIKEVLEINSDLSPDIKMQMLFRYMIGQYSADITKQKFLLRYHLFPADELAVSIRERFKYWSSEESKYISEVLEQCCTQGILDSKTTVKDYYNQYRKFENAKLNEILIYGIMLKEEDLMRDWMNFWTQCLETRTY